MPVENGLPQYVSKHARTGLYQYYRRPPKGVSGAAFVRSFGSKDRKAVRDRYGMIHAEAEAYFARIASGRSHKDFDLKVAAMGLLLNDDPDQRGFGTLRTSEDFRTRLIELDPSLRDLSEPDMTRLLMHTMAAYHGEEVTRMARARADLVQHDQALRKRVEVPASRDGLTLMAAFDTAWMPSKKRSEGTITETKRFVEDFITLNGDLNLKDQTREHWAAWRADCLAVHGPGWTAFKRFSMVKTVVAEAIRAGLMERKYFNGADSLPGC